MGGEAIKGKVMEKKLCAVFSLRDYFDQIKRFAMEDRRLDEVVEPFEKARELRQKREAIKTWIMKFRISQTLPKLDERIVRKVQRQGFAKLL